ncbi:MAG: hypothetical protein JWP19_2203 [Rhodoglobus sp.]|nr:hypothetical protein [Rhodoglobus sp.]
MLLAFRLTNFRSFLDEQVLHLVHSPRERSEGMLHPEILPALAVLGANASGKSNLLRAIELMFGMIRNSAAQPTETLPYQPFLLGSGEPGPTLFEASVQFEGVRYDYGFEYDAERIISEWLYSSPHGRQRTIFERGLGADWYFGDSLKGATQALADATRDNALLLSTARLINHKVLTPLHEQFGGLVKVLRSDTLDMTLQVTLDSLSRDPKRRDDVAKLLKRADLGVASLSIDEGGVPAVVQEATKRFYETVMPDATPEEIQAQIMLSMLRPKLTHSGEGGVAVGIPFEWESVGTRNLLAILGPILDRLATGGVLVVDELDTSLHPRLVSELVKLFVSPRTNPLQAQLVLSTHDVTVMMNVNGYGALERDELWLVEKDRQGRSEVYSIWRYKPRKDEVYSRNYLMGRYGGLPRMDETNFVDILSEDEPGFVDLSSAEPNAEQNHD